MFDVMVIHWDAIITANITMKNKFTSIINILHTKKKPQLIYIQPFISKKKIPHDH